MDGVTMSRSAVRRGKTAAHPNRPHWLFRPRCFRRSSGRFRRGPVPQASGLELN